MRRARLAVFGLVLAPSLAPSLMPSWALAQAARAPTESVTVTGARDRQVLDKFVQSFAAPTHLIGKMARWEDGICPITVGLRPAAASFITQRVKGAAVQVGAPVNSKEGCEHNVAIIFTSAPQALLDNIRKKQPWFLGYADNSDQTKKLAAITRPIQAWYLTATKDLKGSIEIDSSKTVGLGLQIDVPCPAPAPSASMCTYFFPNAHAASVTGNHLGDGLRSIFHVVTIVVDPTKLVDYEIGSLADYIALLALTQLNSLDTCQQLPSIVNLLAENCATKSSALTENDFAYLRGLYKMSSNMNLGTQKNEISYQMEQALKGQ
ncbi:MAG TPA: hypothetical protein VFI23_08285 [Rhizomicrobium sp.]|nr:hypothetical protein [Rhizomicrobium sp.]